MTALAGVFLLFLAGFIAQIPVYSRRLSLQQQATARVPVPALLTGVAIFIAVRIVEVRFQGVEDCGRWIAEHFAGLLGGDPSERTSSLYLAVAASPFIGIIWMLFDYAVAYRRVLATKNEIANDRETSERLSPRAWIRELLSRLGTELRRGRVSVCVTHRRNNLSWAALRSWFTTQRLRDAIVEVRDALSRASLGLKARGALNNIRMSASGSSVAVARKLRAIRGMQIEAEMQIASDSIGALHSLLVKALLTSVNVMITLRSGKVYIGLIVSLGKPGALRHPDAAVKLLPIRSGYRKRDRTVSITTDYSETLARLQELLSGNEDPQDREFVYSTIKSMGQHVRIADIEAATLYSPELKSLFDEVANRAAE